MKIKFYLSIILLCLTAAASEISAQGTFTQIHQILQTNCAGSSCHQYGGNPSFDVTLSESALYAQLVNGNPINPAALAKGDKLISPGYVDRSFLLRKIAHGLNESNPHLDITIQEGAAMPSGLPALSKNQIELVRQWILFGAPLTGDVVDTATINKYYSGKGKEDNYSSHAAPTPGTGFQIYVGKLLIPANTEPYYYIKHNPLLPSSIEIPKVATMLASVSHHFVIYKFLPGGSVNYTEGLRLGEINTSHADVSDGIGTGPSLWQYDLPAGTAYFWEQSTILDLNLHIRNSMADTVLATDIYINIYTQPLGTASKNMLIRNFPVLDIAIPPDSQVHEFVAVANDTNETKYWNIWLLYGHTHQWGTDYDIFIRNPDGSMGSQEYESWNKYELGMVNGQWVNVGYHRYGTDQTFRFYPDDSLLVVDPRLGFIHRARYRNHNTNDTIFFGPTSDDEMMVMGFQYVYGDDLGPLSVKNELGETFKLNVFPNPASDAVSFNYILHERSDVSVQLTNVFGETVSLLEEKNKPVGNYLDEVVLNRRFAAGLYQLTFRAGNSVVVKKIMIE